MLKKGVNKESADEEVKKGEPICIQFGVFGAEAVGVFRPTGGCALIGPPFHPTDTRSASLAIFQF